MKSTAAVKNPRIKVLGRYDEGVKMDGIVSNSIVVFIF